MPLPTTHALRSSTRRDLYICARCAFRASNAPQKLTRRWVETKSHEAEKAEGAERLWKVTADEVRQGKRKSMLSVLEARGLVHDITGPREEIDRMMTDNRLGVYVGIDPTAPSLHIGHMLPLMSLFWMYVHGYQAVTLVGGATARIGDPTNRLTTRDKVHENSRAKMIKNMHYQLRKIWVNVEAYGFRHGYRWESTWRRGLVNNEVWMNKLPIMEALQFLGLGIRIGSMLAKDTVKNKLSKGDGMSFAEFTYPLLQAWDWWHMYNTMGVHMQIGGSDQYGNITAGVDAVKYIAANHTAIKVHKVSAAPPFGFTVPLLTTSTGTKLGKSANNAVWLDKEMTSTFDQYGYFLRTPDDDVGRYLKLFTFMPIEEIDTLVRHHMENPSLRKAQHKLASEFMELVHGETEAASVRKQHELVFQKATGQSRLGVNPMGTNPPDLPQVARNSRPKAQLKLPRILIETKSIGKILYACGLATSASEGHRLTKEGSVYLGWIIGGKGGPMIDSDLLFRRVELWKQEEVKDYLIDGSLLILKRGKHNIRIIDVVDDEEYKSLRLSHPGRDTDSSTAIEADAAAIQEQRLQIKPEMENGMDEMQTLNDDPYHGGWSDDSDRDYSSAEERIRILKEQLRVEDEERRMT